MRRDRAAPRRECTFPGFINPKIGNALLRRPLWLHFQLTRLISALPCNNHPLRCPLSSIVAHPPSSRCFFVLSFAGLSLKPKALAGFQYWKHLGGCATYWCSGNEVDIKVVAAAPPDVLQVSESPGMRRGGSGLRPRWGHSPDLLERDSRKATGHRPSAHQTA